MNPRTGKAKTRLKPVPRKDWIERIVPPIVSNELWARANAALDRNSRKAMAHGRDFLLSLLITCKECERNFMGVTAKQPNGSEIRYYRCIHRYGFDEPDSCPSSLTVRAQMLEDSVWPFVKTYLLRPDLAVRDWQAKTAIARNQKGNADKKIAQLEKQRGVILRRWINAVTLCSDGCITRDDLQEQQRKRDEELASIDAQIAEQQQVTTAAEVEELRFDWAGRLLNDDLRSRLSHDKLTFAEKRMFVEILVISVDIKTIEGQKLPEIRAHFRFSKESDRLQKLFRPHHSVPNYTGAGADIN